MKKSIVITGLIIFLFGCNNNKKAAGVEANEEAPLIDYTVVNTFPHDTTSFTEGLLVHDGQLFESTGHPPDELPKTRSLFGIVDMGTGKINVKVEIDKNKYFGEGIVILNNKVYQLTLSNKIGFIYDASTYKKLGEFSFDNKEGWGLTTDGKYLIMSDGTPNLSYLDSTTLKRVKTVAVTDNGTNPGQLNELEYIKGFIYANVWLSNNIIKIDPATGKVVGRLVLGSLEYRAKTTNPNLLEMNGIAYDAASDKIYVTGKLWPYIYQIQFSH